MIAAPASVWIVIGSKFEVSILVQREDCIRRLNCLNQLPSRRELVDIRTIFITDPKAAGQEFMSISLSEVTCRGIHLPSSFATSPSASMVR